MRSKVQEFYGPQESVVEFAENILGSPLTRTQKELLVNEDAIADLMTENPLPVGKNGFHNKHMPPSGDHLVSSPPS